MSTSFLSFSINVRLLSKISSSKKFVKTENEVRSLENLDVNALSVIELSLIEFNSLAYTHANLRRKVRVHRSSR